MMNGFPYQIRNYRPSDFEDYVKLSIEIEKLDSTGHCISAQALSENLGRPNYSPKQDLFVVETSRKIIGFINITPELIIRRVLIDCLVHPEHRRKGLAKELLGYATRRAKELKAKTVQVSIKQGNLTAKKVLPRLDFQPVREFPLLRLHLNKVRLPDVTHHDYISRHLQLGEEGKLTRLQNRCFANHWGYNPNTTEEIAYSLQLSHCSPEDVVLICDGDKPVGYCWTKINCETEVTDGKKKGRILMMGVDPDYRGKEIGKIALLAGLTLLKNKGVEVVELDVDSENKAARALYRSFGFERWSSTLWYEKIIE